MPLTALDLDPLQLTYQKLKLSVKSRADFRTPDVASHRLALSKALASGTVWVGSMRVSRLNIQISFNDRPLDAEQRAQVLKRLRDCILNAQVSYFFRVKPSIDAISYGASYLCLALSKFLLSVIAITPMPISRFFSANAPPPRLPLPVHGAGFRTTWRSKCLLPSSVYSLRSCILL